MDPKIVGVLLSGMVELVTSPTTAECSVAWCSVVVAVVVMYWQLS